MRSHPNILIVVMDSVRPEWLSCYRPETGTSPNIDRIAAQGVVFETAISASSWTFPAMASLFTGMVPTKHGGHDESMFLDASYLTLAAAFRSGGYDTAAIADVPYVGPMTGLDRGFNRMSNLRRGQVSPWNQVLKGIGRLHRTLTGGYRKTNETPVVIGEAVRWLERGRDRGKPFFLYLHSDETHAPFLPPARFRRMFAGMSASQMHLLNQDKQLYMSGKVMMTDEDFARMHDLARGEVAYFDSWFGRLLDRLERSGLSENTIVVIAADHGENLGEHGLMRHALCLYDTLLRVPLIIRAPGLPPGRVPHMVRLIDLMPTLVSLAGLDAAVAAECQGCDLTQTMRMEESPEFAVSELYRPSQESRVMWQKKVPGFFPEYLAKFDRRLRSYRTRTHKLIWSSDGRHELFDLRSDPTEIRNLIGEQPELAAQLQRALDSWLESFPHAGAESPAQAEEVVDETVMERLRDLGYVD